MEKVILNNKLECPVIGIGTFMLSPAEAENSVREALKMGYSLVDTANAYVNEEGVGRGIQRAIDEGFVTREEIMILHHSEPGSDVGAYQAMERNVRDGKYGAEYGFDSERKSYIVILHKITS